MAGADPCPVLPEKGLLYYPVAMPLPEAAANLYRAAEESEFRGRDFDRAIEALRALAVPEIL